MRTVTELIDLVLDLYPAEWGTVAERRAADDPRYILIFEDRPWNADARWAIAQGLSLLVRRGTLPMVCQDGAYGYIDTSVLRSHPIEPARDETAATLLHDLRISPGEYVSVTTPDKPFILCGVEDRNLYEKAQKLWKTMPLEPEREHGLFRSKNQRKMDAFCELEQDRAVAMVDILLARMEKHAVHVAAVVCCGNLPAHVSAILNFRAISYARIIPVETTAENRDDYIRLSQGGRTQLDELIAKLPGDADWPKDGDWEKLRVSQMYDLETKAEQGLSAGQLLPDIQTLFASPAFRELPVEQKRRVLQHFRGIPFSMLKQLLAQPELEAIFQADIRYLDLEELLSFAEYERLPDFERNIAELVDRVPEDDLQKLQASPSVTPAVKAALARHIASAQTQLEAYVRLGSAPELETDPEFDAKVSDLLADATPGQINALIAAPTVVARVKQALLAKTLIPSLSASLDTELQKPALKPPSGLV